MNLLFFLSVDDRYFFLRCVFAMRMCVRRFLGRHGAAIWTGVRARCVGCRGGGLRRRGNVGGLGGLAAFLQQGNDVVKERTGKEKN